MKNKNFIKYKENVLYIKTTGLLVALLTSTAVSSADLNKPYNLTTGERLAECMERSIPLMDRITVSGIRSYTKYDKHYVSLNSTSTYVDYSKTSKSLNVIFVNNYHIETETSAETAKKELQSISSSLIQTSLGYCSKMLGLESGIKYSMIYIDPPYKSRALKNVIKMDTSGQFTLP